MESGIKILMLEDSAEDSDLLIRHMRRERIDFTCQIVQNRNAFIQGIEMYRPDLIIADYSLPQFSGMEAFRMMKAASRNIPFILVTGTISEKRLIEFAKEGIDDYILKDNLLRLSISIENVVNKKRIERLHQELEMAHKDIRDSINYAKIIQDAMLPDVSLLRESFPDSFILFQPKDVLSGDFYWFRKVADVMYVAAVDCTGHGVPGSLLSMMGFNMLDEAVNSATVRPSIVLRRFGRQFSRIIRQKSAPLNDGMDIAFCAINLGQMDMMYAGANRPLYLLRQHALLEYKPDRAAIGGEATLSSTFKDHLLTIEKGDRIFIFSDGFSDQFHAETDKKMTTRRLQELLIASSYLSFMEQQKQIVDFFEVWKGTREQTDDVLMIGLEIP